MTAKERFTDELSIFLSFYGLVRTLVARLQSDRIHRIFRINRIFLSADEKM